MTIRESGVAAAIGWAMAAWAALFALNTAIVADLLTSPQWRSLMTVPGGKWFWTGIFGAGAFTLTAGLLTRRYGIRGNGFALIGAGCFLIAVFYLIAPLFHLGPITLGYWPWLVPVALGMLGTIVNWRPIEWF